MGSIDVVDEFIMLIVVDESNITFVKLTMTVTGSVLLSSLLSSTPAERKFTGYSNVKFPEQVIPVQNKLCGVAF